MVDRSDHSSQNTHAVTFQDIANYCGVSKMTVSYALRGGPRVLSQETRNRVLAAAKELGYDPAVSHNARRLAMRRSGKILQNQVIGLCFPAFDYWGNHFNILFNSILRRLHTDHYSLLSSPAISSNNDALPPVFERGDVDGVIMYFFPEQVQLIARLRALRGFGRRPIVMLLNTAPDTSAVITDDYLGGYLLTKHLLDLGHRQFLHFYDEMATDSNCSLRVAGMRQACRNYGLDPDMHIKRTPFAIIYNTSYQETQRKELLEILRHTTPKITAVLAPNDLVATILQQILLQEGYRIPEDLSLVGYDDSEDVIGGKEFNKLTTVSIGLQEIGEKAAALAVQQVTTPSQPNTVLKLPVQLIIRGSTGPCPR